MALSQEVVNQLLTDGCTQEDIELLIQLSSINKEGAENKEQQDVKKNHEKTFLFRLTNNSVTFHILGAHQDVKLEMLPVAIQEIIKQAKTIITEQFERDPIDELTRCIKKYDGFSNKNEYSTFDKRCQEIIENALSASSGAWLLQQIKIAKLKPWVIYGFYFLHTVIMKGMNEQIITRATKNKHQIFGLESTADRIDAYGLPNLNLKQCQEKIIELSIAVRKKEQNQPTSTNDYFKANFIKFYDRGNAITSTRNKNFLKNLLKHLGAGLHSVLVELDVTHLPGETGLLKLLNDKGFSIQQYNAAGVAFNYDPIKNIAEAPSNFSNPLIFSSSALPQSEGLFDNLAERKQSKEIDEQAKLKISDYLTKIEYELGKAVGKGDCFFDAVGQALLRKNVAIPKEYQGESDYKKLRQVCATYAKNHRYNKDHWLKMQFDKEKDYQDYLLTVGFTAPEVNTMWQQKRLSSGVALWGRSDIDGRIICEILKFKLHVIEIMVVENQIVLAHQMIDANGSKPMVNEKEIGEMYNDPTIVHLAVYQHSLHFVPVLSRANSNAKCNTV